MGGVLVKRTPLVGGGGTRILVRIFYQAGPGAQDFVAGGWFILYKQLQRKR